MPANKKNIKPLLILLLFGWVASPALKAQQPAYDVHSIPAAVLKDADVVKRFENIYFEVTDIDRATLKVHQILTVLNEKGKHALIFSEHSSKFTTLGDVEIKVYDKNGRETMKYKKKDLTTISMGDGLIDDGRLSYLTVAAGAYPVTVEYSYEKRYRGTLFYPSYQILTPGESVENSEFTAKVPKELDLRFKERNIKLTPQVKDEGKYKQYTWSVKNLAPFVFEEGTVSYERLYPAVTLAPNRFKMDDYEGDMTSWKSFGMWYATLKKGIDVLPAENQAFLQQLVKNAGSERAKVKIIYDHLQKNFRYVSIQLGIGGYKPFPAAFTDKNKYGDCKGLSNYMQAALAAIGIKSYQALINAEYNKEPVDTDFPCNEFNHVILCVPQPKDSIWLECTSNTNDFAVLGSFTENRNALLITEAGGVLVSTPASKAEDNRYLVTTRVVIQEDGSGTSTSHFNTSGSYKEDMKDVLNEKKDDQKESIVYTMRFKQPDEFELNGKEGDATFITSLNMTLEKIPEFVAGNKMFISPRMYKLTGGKLPKAENRKQDYFFLHPFTRMDTTVFQLPAGYKPDALPQAKDIKCIYATYTTKYWFDAGQKAVYSTARLVLDRHRIPVADYAAVKKFFDDVLQDDTQRIVIVKE